MATKLFTFVKRYLTVKTKASCEVFCKEGRDKKITVTDTENGEGFLFMRKDFLYSHCDTTLTMCHLIFVGDDLESLELEESDFLPNFTSKAKFLEHIESNIKYKEQNEEDKEEINKTIEEHKQDNVKSFEEINKTIEEDKEEINKTIEEHKESNIESFEKNEEEHTEIKNLIEKSNCEEITWSELKQLRDNNELISGKWYCITDYTCVTNSTITTIKSGDHPFYVLVLATSDKTLSETAFAKTMPYYFLIINRNDTAEQAAEKKAKAERINYFSDNQCNLDAWELKYCLDNDQTRFPWCGSDDDGGKGVVWYMKDEYENETYYDFKNIMEVRYEITASTASDFSFSMSKVFTKETSRSGWTIDTTNLLYFYTFSYCLEAELTQDKILDLSVQNLESLGTDDVEVSFGNNKLLDNHFFEGTTTSFSINCFLVINGVNSNLGTLSSFSLRDNKLTGVSSENTFNCLHSYNSATYDISTNRNILNNSGGNTIGCNSSSNYFNNSNYDISIGYGSSNNCFGNGNYDISIGYGSSNNCFGNGNYDISIGYGSSNNCFGNGNYGISIGYSSHNNCFGNGNYDISIGYGCKYNIFGSYNQYITMNHIDSYNTIGNGNKYIDFTASGAYGSQGCFVGNYIINTSSSHKTITSQTRQQYWS